MNKGVFYSVGVGPGDPALLTYKAAQTIARCEIIAAPQSGGAENLALKIAAEHIQGKRIVTCAMPMTRDAATLREYHQQAEAQLRQLLEQGLNVAFLTIGDPSIYSTAMYIHQRLATAGFETRVIPGVPSFCAAAASLNTSLCEGGQPLHIIPASYGGSYTALPGVKVLMKSGQALGEVLAKLQEQEAADIMLVERASMVDEHVYRSATEIPAQAGYFSLAVVKPTEEQALSQNQEQTPPQNKENTLLPNQEQRPLAETKKFFPLFISSSGKKALIVGGGPIAARRASTLLQFSFNITVVAPQAIAEIETLHEQHKLTFLRREFRDEDLQGCFLAVVATDDRAVNCRVGELATQRGIWVSMADQQEECSFLFPAIAANEQIIAGLSSEGRSHQAVREAAQRIREALR